MLQLLEDRWRDLESGQVRTEPQMVEASDLEAPELKKGLVCKASLWS